MKKVLKNVLALVKEHPCGIPLEKIDLFYNMKYQKKLSLSSLGFTSMDGLVASLDELVVSGELVFYKAHLQGQGQDGASTEAGKNSKKSKKVLQNIVEIVKMHRNGIPLKKLAVIYNQNYHQNLTLASLGFNTITCLVESLDADLVVEGQQVFHKSHRPQNQHGAGTLPETPQTAESHIRNSDIIQSVPVSRVPMTFGCNPHTEIIFGAALSPASSLFSTSGLVGKPVMIPSQPAEKLTQGQLLERVTEVMKIYQPKTIQLITDYAQQFGTELPLDQYMSLYDHWEAGKLDIQSGPVAKYGAAKHSKPVLSQTTPDAPKQHKDTDSDQTPDVQKTPEREQREQAGSIISELDFPALGSNIKSTREQTHKAPHKDGSLPVFRDAYHAQLRERHGDNVRAQEAAERDEKELGQRRHRNLNPDVVNSLAEDVIREIAAAGDNVTKEKVMSRVCTLLQISYQEADRLRFWKIQALKDLEYTMREINMFIQCTEAVMAICTLYELGQALAALKDKKRYEELNLGPLCKLPLIHRLFKIDGNTKDDDIHQIETVDILRQLQLFRQKNKGTVDLAEFMKHLADHYNCNSPYELGIRITSIGLAISSIGKVNRNQSTIMVQARDAIQKDLEEEIHERMRKLKKSVMEPLQGAAPFSASGSTAFRNSYISMTAAEVVLAVFTNAEGVFSPRMAKHVQNFLIQVSGDRLATALFQLAICGGSLDVPKDLVPKDKPSNNVQMTKNEAKPVTSLPSEAAVKQFLKENLSGHTSPITLGYIAVLERKLAKHFQVNNFISLQQGSFLEFLVKHIQLLQETVGFTLNLGSITEGSGFRPTRQDIFEFIKQCGDITSTDPDALFHIESALRSHYGVQDSRDLCLGSLRMLADLVRRQREMLAGAGISEVYYESALFANHSSPPVVKAQGACDTVGLLGEVSKVQALASLLSCPLLEDLSQWSQWDLIFKPCHGSLKDFIERNAANSGLAALEVSPGLLLRITTHTGDKPFSCAAMNLDPIGTAGHLVSMVVTDGIANAPMALLANHVESSLAAAVAKEKLSTSEDDMSSYNTVAKFLLECFTRIPARTCQLLLQQVFLEPFSHVLGQAKSKKVLLTVAQSDVKYLNCVHRLGLVLGITEWGKDYQKKMNQPQNPTEQRHSPPLDYTKSNLMDSESSSASALSECGDLDLEDHSDHSLQQVDGDQGDAEEEDDEEFYELSSVPKAETSSFETEGACGEEHAVVSDSNETDSFLSESEATLSIQRSIIEDIRKNEFGIGVELTAESQKLMEVHQERLGRSLDRLSTELYSKDTHFVLELIQNADDNSYPADPGFVPSLAFVVERDCITILNNETGFQETNIRAICDVGRSTKGKHKYGYIGQKGIGFKSVFKVTDCPEIHSNGFHLHFDKTCGPMGYILPHWTEDERPMDTQLSDVTKQSWTTKICLPLRSECHQTRNLFHDVHPSLLLFLHRLRSITIYSQSEKRLMAMTRKDLSHNVLEVEHTEGTERWLVVRCTLQPRKIKDDVESTELALAFQLGSDITGSDTICQPQKQPVFAFLPLRSFGFRFIIQGDFDIPSSREDVDRDSSWNQWLRSEIPQLFLQAMDVFTDHPEFSGLKGLCHFLQFVPLPDEVLDFFKPVAGQIIQLLKGKAFLPTLSSGGKVVYKLPSQVAICQDAVIRDVIGVDELDRHLSLSYLHPSLHPAPPAPLLTHLGVRNLRGSDVTAVTTAMAKELMQVEGIHSNAGLRQLARLLVCNFRALEHGYGEEESILQALRDLPIIPLADKRLVALGQEEVFFPMEETKSKKRTAQSQNGPLSALYKDISVVHPSLLSCVEPLEGHQVRELLKRLGVHELEPRELLEKHIYPSLRNNKWKSKPDAVVVSYLVFMKQHISSSQECMDTVPVLTSRGLLCPSQDRVHFSEEYGNVNLPEKLPGCDWVLLSPCYLQTDGDLAGWRSLFTELGVRDGLIIRKERRTLTAEELASSPWSEESANWQQNSEEGVCVLDDYNCEEFHALATAQLPDFILLEQRRALLELLATNWDTGYHYSQYDTAHVIDCDGRPIRNTKSSFFLFMRNLQWVPAYWQLEGDTQETKYLCPNSVYLTSPEVTDVLGTHVYYVNVQPSKFSRDLGMRHSISVESLIHYLKEWGMKHKGDTQEWRHLRDGSKQSDFTSTVQHIHSVYTYLHTNCPQSSLKELFQHTPVVFIVHSKRADNWCSGRFYLLKEVCWSEPTTLFHRYKMLTQGPESCVQQPRILAPFYSPLEGMRDFFTRLLNVDPSPNMNQYVGLLEMICSSAPIPTANVLQDVSLIYATLAQKCKIQLHGDRENIPSQAVLNSSYCSTLRGMVSDKKVFPTKDNNWVTLGRRPMISDSKELDKIFKPHKQVCLLNLPPAEKKTAHKTAGQPAAGERSNSMPVFREQDRTLFLEDICGIRRLSQCVQTEPQTENLRPCPTMQAMVRSLVPYIQRFLYHHEELADVYSELLHDDIGAKVKRLYFGQVGKLYIRYQLDVTDSEDAVVELQDVICLLKDKKELYIQKDHLSAKLDICRELVTLFCTENHHRKELMHFLSGLITSLNDSVALKRFLQKEDIRELPSVEEKWEVPEPKQEVFLERVLSSSHASASSVTEPPKPARADGAETLACWPPRASIQNTGASPSERAEDGVVEAVMKLWPPPAGPKDRYPETDATRSPVDTLGDGLQKTTNHPVQQNPPVVTNNPQLPESAKHHIRKEPDRAEGGQENLSAHKPTQNPPPAHHAKTNDNQSVLNEHNVVPTATVIPSRIQESEVLDEAQPRPPMNLDIPFWNKADSPQAMLEDIRLTCQRPTTVVFHDDQGDVRAIGTWGEQLVNSFLCQWKDSNDPGRPMHILWCNQNGETGEPYDFKLTFGGADGELSTVYVEVKATVKKEKAFIHLSLNELNFALKKKECYHILRVYSAGDAKNVRLSRIQNVEQHLRTKNLKLYLFI